MAALHTSIPSAPAAALVLLLGIAHRISAESEFNFEVGERIHERVSGFMGTPVAILGLIERYRTNSVFDHDMRAPDRDAFFRLNAAFIDTYPQFQSIYYGLEDGMFAGHGFSKKIANYREPGHSGYAISDDDTPLDIKMEKYYAACVDSKTGQSLPCEMKVGGKYTNCVNDCALEKCDDELSQKNCTVVDDEEERLECEGKIKWCKSYEIKPVTNEDGRLGYVPRAMHCIRSDGVPSQAVGKIAKGGTNELGNCLFEDGVTLVQRNLTGDYAYCGEGPFTCSNTFNGAYADRDYDPRFRGWYIGTKALQEPNWSPPYAFFSSQQIGITFSLPIYKTHETIFNEHKNVFEGVLAVDYTFTEITTFLNEMYKDSTTIAAIFEKDEPHYVIGTSTGNKGVNIVQETDCSTTSSSSGVIFDCIETTPCPDPTTSDNCKAVRVPAAELAGYDNDVIVRLAFLGQQRENFPGHLISFRAEDGTLYASHVKSFSIDGSNLEWMIMVMAPVEIEDYDTIVSGDSLFGAMIAIPCIGFVICGGLGLVLVKYRNERAIINSDWRFLSAFTLSCGLLNLSCLSFLGPNTNELCLLRQWLIHFFFVLALSLLFAKVFRMFKLMGSAPFTRVVMTHSHTAKLATPLVLLQVVILLTFTFVDPSKREGVVEASRLGITNRYICSHETPAFFITMAVYEGGLILVGCVLAFMTRNLRSEFNESKQIILAMYGTAAVSTILLAVVKVSNIYQSQMRFLFALGLFWATCLASCVFVIPRIIDMRKPLPSGVRISDIGAPALVRQEASHNLAGRAPNPDFNAE